MTKGFRDEEIEAARAARDAQRHIVTRLEDELLRRRIEAPFDGYVTERYTEVGQWVDEGGPVVTLVRLDEVEVRVQVEENAIREIQVGQQVDVYVDALGNEPFSGEIRQIIPRANWQQGSRSFPVVVRLANTTVDNQPRLKEGMLARITFHGIPRETLLVNKDSVVRSSGRPVVFVVEADNRVRAVEVRDGMSQGQFIEIEGDIRDGDRLVTEGVERLRPFQQVLVLENGSDEALSSGKNLPSAQTEQGVGASEAAIAREPTGNSQAVKTSGG
jgi:RND family efflux transporter MFP subunit